MSEAVRLTGRCNSRCLFCPRPPACAGGLDDEDPARVLRRLHELREGGARRVVLTGGEPTVTVVLSLAVAEAHTLGFEEIIVRTNGRRLADGAYTRRLVRGGLTHAVVSLHGYRPEVHDAITRTPGSFAEATDGVVALRRHGVDVTCALVLARPNLGELRAYVDLVKALGAGAVTLRTLRAWPAGAAHDASLGVTPAEAAPFVRPALAYGAARGLRMISLGLRRAALDSDLRYYH